MDIQTILSEVDHTVLAPTSPAAKFAECCDFAAAHHCASVCICPFYVKEAAARLRGTGVAVCTVIGFPHGTHATAAKVAEARIAIDDGADELDMVVNVSKVKDGDWDYVRADIKAVLDAVHGAVQSAAQPLRIGRERKRLRRGQLFGRHLLGRVGPARELLDARGLAVEADDLPRPGERHRQRKPDVAEPDDAEFT